MRANGVLQQFEITEADLPGRHRGEEYKAEAGSSQWKVDRWKTGLHAQQKYLAQFVTMPPS